MAGKSAKLKEFKDDLKGNIIDINEDDMKVSEHLYLQHHQTFDDFPPGQPY